MPPIVHDSEPIGSGPSRRPKRGELVVQDVEHHPRLHDHRLGRDRDDPAEVAAEVDDQPLAERLARHGGPRPSRVDGQAPLGRVPDQVHHVGLGPRRDHPERVDLVQAGVVRVRGPFERLEQQLALDDPAQVVVNAGATLVHGWVETSLHW